MTEKEIETLLDLISNLVSESGISWREKKVMIENAANENDLTNLLEFTAWFSEEEEDDEDNNHSGSA